MSVKFILSVLDCHWIVPVLPVTVNLVLFVPAHTVVSTLILPETETGFTVTIALGVLIDGHKPFVTTAL